MKKTLSLLLAALLVLSSFSFVFAAEVPTITMGTVDATALDASADIVVPVTIDKFPDGRVKIAQIDILFDNTKLEFLYADAAAEGYEDAMRSYDTQKKRLTTPEWGANDVAINRDAGGRVLWNAGTSKNRFTTDNSLPTSNVLTYLIFSKKAGATGTAEVKLAETTALTDDAVDTAGYTYYANKGEVTLVNGSVKLTNDAPVLDKDVTLKSVTVGSDVKTAAPYTFEVDNTVDMVDIIVEPTSTKATVTCDKAVASAEKTFPSGKLDVGENKFVFTVVAEDTNFKQTYDVIINKAAAPKSDNAKLSALEIAGVTLTPAFAADVTSYTASVENTVDKVTVTATAADSKATVAGTGEKTLAVGNNAITVEVTAENGTTTKTYTITVNRAAAPVPVTGAKVAGSVDKTEVKTAEKVVVTVNFTDLDTASALQYDLSYDKDAFTYVSSSLADDAINTTAEGTIKVALAQGSAFTGNAVEGMTFTFDAKSVEVDKDAEFVIANAAYGSKDADAKLWSKVEAANYTQPGKVTVKAATDPLAKAKAEAITAIEAKVVELETANKYFSDNNLDKAKADAIAAIEAAADEAAVTAAKDAGITALEAVETKDKLVADKKKAVDTAASVKDNYFEEEMQLVYSAVVAKQNDADKAATKAELDAITAPDFAGIKTKAEVRADAKAAIDTALGTYDENNYYADEFAEIAKIAADAKAAVDADTITKSADVKAIADKAATDMLNVKTKAVVALERINAKGEYTVELFEDAGVTDAKAENLNKYKLGVTNAGKTLTKEEVQEIVNAMNAVVDPAVKGDLNSNGETDAGDAAIILKFVAGTLSGVTVDANFLVTADVNGDGVITSGDASQVLNIVLNK